MAKATTTDLFKCSRSEFFKIISDYEKYPEFLQEVKSCKVIKVDGTRKLVEFQVQLIKSFKYCLWMNEVENQSIDWEFASGDLFKSNSGSWKLQDEAGKCRATYSLDVGFTMFVPGPIANTLVNVNLPNMMSSYHKRVGLLHG
ncbi:MAG TPA: SRPBCC family protein [Pseudobdellovibrionaceae bacterium]|jgi:coenzyme Q-binding protein COQ10|nr:SRPBCC family protein [Pseudobdellovibrionaceae bacterium]